MDLQGKASAKKWQKWNKQRVVRLNARRPPFEAWPSGTLFVKSALFDGHSFSLFHLSLVRLTRFKRKGVYILTDDAATSRELVAENLHP